MESSSEDEFYSADESLDDEDLKKEEIKSFEANKTETKLENKIEHKIENVTVVKEDTKSAPTKYQSQQKLSQSPKDEEVEFVVKNLDTGESFSSKEIEKYIPKGIDPKSLDPIAYNILERSPSKSTVEQSPVISRKQKWLNKIKEAPLVKKKEKHKKKKLFAQVLRQHMEIHKGAVWVMKFSYDGTLLATGGTDGIVKVWKVLENGDGFFEPQPYRQLIGHGGDVLELSWSISRSNLLLSCSMDKTVRKWEVNGGDDCKHIFQHNDVVTAVLFHPKNEEQFITGCLDNKIRLWNIRDGTITCSAVVECGFITAVAFTLDGETIMTGSYDGTCTFFNTKGMQFKLQKAVRNPIKKGKKITGIQMMPKSKYALISSNDSRIRLYNMVDHTVVWTYKGIKNENYQVYATFSEPKGSYIICGSEDHHVYMWPNSDDRVALVSKSTRVHDSFQAHSSTVTASIFAPFDKRKTTMEEGQIIVTADVTGEMKVFENKLLKDGRASYNERQNKKDEGKSKHRSLSS